MDAKGRTSVKDRVAVKLATTVARPKTLAKARAVALPTAASLAFSHLHNLYPPGSPGGIEIKRAENLRGFSIPYCSGLLAFFMAFLKSHLCETVA
jgi:hypothetical protein